MLVIIGKSVPIIKSDDSGYQKRMEEHEFYAIETFGSTGRGYVVEVSFHNCVISVYNYNYI